LSGREYRVCYVDFYRPHCLVREAAIPAIRKDGGQSTQKFCGTRCKDRARANPVAFQVPARFTRTAPKPEIQENQASESDRRPSQASDTEDAAADPENPDKIADDSVPSERATPAIGWRGAKVPTERGGWAEQAGLEHHLVDAQAITKAKVVRRDDGYALVYPVAIPQPHGLSLNQAKSEATSLALAALPLDKATQARVRQAARECETTSKQPRPAFRP
jgi:hypothetical protein